jgi:hypothetical protein
MPIDIVQVATNLIVAWISGAFGVRRALQQTKQQRGLERRLEWYEKTVRMTLKYRVLMEEAAIAVRNQNLETMQRLVKEQGEILKNVEQAVDESMVFAERATYVSLNKVFRELGRRIRQLPADPNDNLSRTAQTYDELAKLIERACLDLANSIRKQLGLDELKMRDIESP